MVDSVIALLYSKPSSNVAVTGDVTGNVELSLVTGTENPYYPLARLIDLDPATSFKTNTSGDCRVQWRYFNGAQRVDAMFIPMYNMPAGTVIRIEGNSAASWGSPAFSTTYTVPAYEGGIPRGIFVNVTEASGYSPSGYTYWSLYIPNTGSPIALGEVHLSSLLEEARHLEDSPEEIRAQLVIEHEREDGGRFVYQRGIQAYVFSGSVEVPLTELADYRALWADTYDGYYPFFVVVHVWEDQPEGFMMLWKGNFQTRHVLGDRYTLTIQWITMSRGRVP